MPLTGKDCPDTVVVVIGDILGDILGEIFADSSTKDELDWDRDVGGQEPSFKLVKDPLGAGKLVGGDGLWCPFIKGLEDVVTGPEPSGGFSGGPAGDTAFGGTGWPTTDLWAGPAGGLAGGPES